MREGIFYSTLIPIPIHFKRFTSPLTISSCLFTGNSEMPGYHPYSWNVFWNTIPVSSQKHLSSTNLNPILKIIKKKKIKKCTCILPSLRKFSLLSFSILKKKLMFYPDIKIPQYHKNSLISSTAQSIFHAFFLPIFLSPSDCLFFCFFFLNLSDSSTEQEDFKECFSEEPRSLSPENKHWFWVL